jgi:hypothetical protein
MWLSSHSGAAIRENVGMKARSTTDVDEFLDAGGAMLLEDPARNQLILGILGAVRKQPDLYDSYQAWWVEEEGSAVAAASMTSPWNLVLADALSHWAVPHLVEAIASSDVNVPGVVGNRPTVDRFVEGWCATKGSEAEVLVEQGVFVLESVSEIPLPEGDPRPMTEAESELIADWWEAFIDDALPSESHPTQDIGQIIERKLDEEYEQGLWVWDLHGRPVSMSSHSSFNFGGSRIGPVYTPPEHRGSGYGTALVAAQSQKLLDRGLQFVYLYTDLANSTSNDIYRKIGFEQVADSAQVRFSDGV